MQIEIEILIVPIVLGLPSTCPSSLNWPKTFHRAHHGNKTVFNIRNERNYQIKVVIFPDFLLFAFTLKLVHVDIGLTVKKIGHCLEHVRTNLRFFGLGLSFHSSF